MRLHAVIAIAGDALKPPLIVTHKPDHELHLRRHAGVHHRNLEVSRPALVIRDSEPDRGVLLCPGTNLVYPFSDVLSLRFGGLQMVGEKERDGTQGHAEDGECH